MAKKKSSWLPPEEETVSAAKKVIQKSTNPISKNGREEGNTRGPKKREDKLIRLLVKDEDRKKLKRIAADLDETMIDAFSIVIQEAWDKRNS